MHSQTAALTHASKDMSISRASILIVEDDENLLEGIRTILELEHYRVQTAADGLQALSMLRNGSGMPDLIVSDIMMPGMDGFALLDAVRREAQWVAIPFIFLTAKDDRTDMQLGKRLGVDDYLVKPFDAEDLLIAVESRLRRHQALHRLQTETINTVKRNILTILNHEFRTPLTFVVAYADMLNGQDVADLSDAELLTFLRGVGSGASRLRQLIENFILLVELETGDAVRTFEWRRSAIENPDQLLEAVVERLRPGQPPERSFVLEVQDAIPPFIADREYLQVALTQLTANALKFSPPDRPVTLGAHVEGGEVHLWVRDHGRGIAERELEAIWQVFYQVDRDHHEDQGTGSGLAIVQGIARLHDGRVAVRSRVNEGSTFSIILPLP